ncbi:hypothetical protein [Paenibacillus glycinis]|uniref:DUF2976 domain-containing protein n=1 Tax=Paenibacillus glycinis TaxID=2697035 RepID=A0ABW9XRZ8_9BACL|nr:hypothetical protein [Paenibacillus glycinis]NBD25405.1 hypothetical protein [Paenibacillus glycinis]
MERKLIKAGLYGFIFGLFIAILYYPDTKIVHEGSGMISAQTVPIRDLVFDILRASVRTSIAFVIAYAVFSFYRNLKQERFDLRRSIADFLKAFVIGLLVLAAVYFLIGVIIR